MSLTLQQLEAIRRKQREREREHEAEAEARVHARLEALFAFDTQDEPVEWLPCPVPIGWRQIGKVDGGLRYCLSCCPTQPTSTHTVLDASSYLASKPCLCCGRRIDGVNS